MQDDLITVAEAVREFKEATDEVRNLAELMDGYGLIAIGNELRAKAETAEEKFAEWLIENSQPGE